MRFDFIARHVLEFHVTVMCRVLQVSKAGYYAWRIRREGPDGGLNKHQRANEELTGKIRSIHSESRLTYGSPRVYAELVSRGVSCSENRVARLMRAAGLRGVCRRHRGIRTTNSLHSYPTAPNVLDRRFSDVTTPNTVWAADITYIRTLEGWLYLAVVIDLSSKRIVGFSMKPSLERSITIDALSMALVHRRPKGGVLHHSDRGSQYACEDYRNLLAKYGLSSSMSRKGDCYDNAVMESFFATLKTELAYRTVWRSHEEAKRDIFEYIEVWYNRKRRHSSLGFVSPAEYENMLQRSTAATPNWLAA